MPPEHRLLMTGLNFHDYPDFRYAGTGRIIGVIRCLDMRHEAIREGPSTQAIEY